MSFREKSTWVTFVLLLVMFIIYFSKAFFVLHGHSDGSPVPGVSLFGLFWLLVAGFVVVEIVVHILLASFSPKEANAPLDEREKLIAMKSTQPAFYVLLVGAFLSIGTIHLRTDAFHLAHSVLFIIWIAELVRYGMQLFYFRRGV